MSSMRAFRVEWLCPFCSHSRPAVVITTLQLGILEAASAAGRSNSVLAVFASPLHWSNEVFSVIGLHIK